jgi:hypothetical protein
LCDDVIRKETGLKVQTLNFSTPVIDTVRLSSVSSNNSVRMDARFHRGEVRAVLTELDDVACVPLQFLLQGGRVIKGTQRVLAEETEDWSDARVIATVSIQNGQVVPELTKAIDDEQVNEAGERKVLEDDLLISMDGEGSLGKVAIFKEDFAALTDSHVSILRLSDPTLALALGCYLNSSLGQAQVELFTSGATGQTQVSVADLLQVAVPRLVIEQAQSIQEQYSARIKTYQAVRQVVRRSLCEGYVGITEKLLSLDAFLKSGSDFVDDHSTEEKLMTVLDMLRPEMF